MRRVIEFWRRTLFTDAGDGRPGNRECDLRASIRKQDFSFDRELARADLPNPSFRETGEFAVADLEDQTQPPSSRRLIPNNPVTFISRRRLQSVAARRCDAWATIIRIIAPRSFGATAQIRRKRDIKCKLNVHGGMTVGGKSSRRRARANVRANARRRRASRDLRLICASACVRAKIAASRDFERQGAA